MNEKPNKTVTAEIVNYCCVKNCHKKLKKDDLIKFGDCIFCKSCGTAVIKQSILG